MTSQAAGIIRDVSPLRDDAVTDATTEPHSEHGCEAPPGRRADDAATVGFQMTARDEMIAELATIRERCRVEQREPLASEKRRLDKLEAAIADNGISELRGLIEHWDSIRDD